ncbi:MAG: branched-chain-amino-acid transaminase [Verrucomicrobiales bacterium]
MSKIYINGEIVDEAAAKISVFDHGLLYGDGVFEGIRFYQGRVFELDAHISRLFDSAHAIRLEIGMEPGPLSNVVLETIAANELKDGYVRLLVTRGVGSLGLSPFLCEKASIIVIASRISLYPEEKYRDGLSLITCASRRLTPGALSPNIKSLNYLNNVLAKIEAIDAGCEEGVMLNEQGYVAECTGDNIFIVKNGRISTPPVAAGSLNGITRGVVMGIVGEMDYPLNEPMLTRYDVYTADECFLTGTAAEVIPAVLYDGRKIGRGVPGPVTLECIERFRALAESSGTPIYN